MKIPDILEKSKPLVTTQDLNKCLCVYCEHGRIYGHMGNTLQLLTLWENDSYPIRRGWGDGSVGKATWCASIKS